MMRKFYGIELLRFLASLAIVIFHWGLSFGFLDLDANYTYKNIFNIIYLHGDIAVSIFFVISGIVFSNVYLDEKKNSSFVSFFVKRFARLYPLHILTLFLIIIIQFLFSYIFGSNQLYTFNDLYHLFLNIFLLLGIGLEEGRSFNSPVWTVAMEVYVYFVFFFCIAYIRKYKILFVLLIYSLIIVVDKTNAVELDFIRRYLNLAWFIDYARLFFSGVFIFLLEKKFRDSKFLYIGTILLLIITSVIKFYFFIFIPSLVMFFVLIDKIITSKEIKKIFEILGSLTYSMYLLHTVTFLYLLFILRVFDKVSFFYLDITFILYLASTILLSLLSFRYFEKPLNIKIREKLLN
jgi:peptidoglycan/LPS O-acetylase OafA/YrhL